jgi:hypothetical protein
MVTTYQPKPDRILLLQLGKLSGDGTQTRPAEPWLAARVDAGADQETLAGPGARQRRVEHQQIERRRCCSCALDTCAPGGL